ncbi:hypothetical protein AVEN_121844-1 [Araneus ventricosus]|uniref:Uncharacterized protein n=1 Tax=Araneus ventricosus TaxID=182803 RepID=A0A4Y2JTE6_ARAVE|nr:hypothetical protein AVEN_121844-1 [Araneus ventricosus]
MDDNPRYGCREICQATRRRNRANGRNSTDHSPTRGLPSRTPWEQSLMNSERFLGSALTSPRLIPPEIRCVCMPGLLHVRPGKHIRFVSGKSLETNADKRLAKCW